MGPSDALLRTFAAVPPGARVVDAASGDGRHLVPLARLGFDVWGAAVDPAPARAALADVRDDAERRVAAAPPDALPYADASAEWMVVADVPDLGAALAEAARVLTPGGWVWTEGPSADALAGAAAAAGLLVATPPAAAGGRVHATFRAPGGDDHSVR